MLVDENRAERFVETGDVLVDENRDEREMLVDENRAERDLWRWMLHVLMMCWWMRTGRRKICGDGCYMY